MDAERLLKHVAAQILVEARISQVDNIRKSLRDAQVVEIEIVGGALYLKIRNVRGFPDADVFITSGACVGSEYLGSYEATDQGGFPTLYGPGGNIPCARMDYWILDGCGNLFIVGSYGCFDVFPVVRGLGGGSSQAEIERILEKYKFRSEQRITDMSITANNDLNEVLDNMDNPLKAIAASTAAFELQQGLLSDQFETCESVFERDEYVAMFDTVVTFVATELIIAVATAGLATAATSALRALLYLRHLKKLKRGADVLRHGGRYGDDVLTGGMCFVAGTQVVTKDSDGQKTTKPIEDIEVGDKVWSRSDVTGHEVSCPQKLGRC